VEETTQQAITVGIDDETISTMRATGTLGASVAKSPRLAQLQSPFAEAISLSALTPTLSAGVNTMLRDLPAMPTVDLVNTMLRDLPAMPTVDLVNTMLRDLPAMPEIDLSLRFGVATVLLADSPAVREVADDSLVRLDDLSPADRRQLQTEVAAAIAAILNLITFLTHDRRFDAASVCLTLAAVLVTVYWRLGGRLDE
jgi:hypothetical protein